MLAGALARLERGAGAVVTASGMAAVDLVLSRLRADDLLLAPHDCYGGTHRLLHTRASRYQFSVEFVDQTDDAALLHALDATPALVIVETPSNPLMRVVDIAAIARAAATVGAKVAVDNTFLSLALQLPLTLGADYVIHSTTKYLNGHSDVIGGAVVCADRTEADALAHWANVVGTTGSPFDAWLTLRGLRTLFPRMERQQRNPYAVAAFLEGHPAVARVHYPGLPSHPQHALAGRQQHGPGAMLSFELAGGIDAVRALLPAMRLFRLAQSLGGVESLVSHPVTMTHADMDEDDRRRAGVGEALLRLSIGLEEEADLLADLKAGLAAIRSTGGGKA